MKRGGLVDCPLRDEIALAACIRNDPELDAVARQLHFVRGVARVDVVAYVDHGAVDVIRTVPARN